MDPFVGEIRMFAGNFAPRGWALCNGDLISVRSNTVLFTILGTIYGGDGKNTFALPNLQGRAPMHPGQSPGLSIHNIGENGGIPSVTLLTSELPAHSHQMQYGVSDTTQENPGDGSSFTSTKGRRAGNAYTSDSSKQVVMHHGAISTAGGSQPHNNMQPYLGLNFIIALQGDFPTRS